MPLTGKNSENRRQSQTCLSYAEVHPVLRIAKNNGSLNLKKMQSWTVYKQQAPDQLAEGWFIIDQGDGSTDPFYYLFVVSQYLTGMSEQVRFNFFIDNIME